MASCESTWFQEADRLKNLIAELHERVRDLEFLNKQEAVSNYCDLLASQIMVAVDSGIKHLQQIGEKLLGEINDYRHSLLQTEPENETLVSIDSNDKPTSTIGQELAATRQQLASLSDEIKQFSERSTSLLSSPDQLDEQRLLEETFKGISYENRLREMAKTIRELTFNKQFLKFKENRLFTFENEQLGFFEFASEDPSRHSIQNSSSFQIRLQKSVATHLKNNDVSHVRFYEKNLISINNIKGNTSLWIYDMIDDELFHGLSYRPLSTHVVMLDPLIIGGCHNGDIMIFDGIMNRPLKTCELHKSQVVSVKSLPSGYVVSCSRDGLVNIWNPHVNIEKRVILSFRTDSLVDNCSQLEVLSNGFLLTLHPREANSYLQIWNPRSGRLVYKIDTSLSNASNMLVLKDDRVALGPINCEIHILDLFEKEIVKTLTLDDPQMKIASFAQMPSGFIVAGGFAANSNFYIWDLEWSKPRQIIPSGLDMSILSLDISANGKEMVSTGGDCFVQLWALEI